MMKKKHQVCCILFFASYDHVVCPHVDNSVDVDNYHQEKKEYEERISIQIADSIVLLNIMNNEKTKFPSIIIRLIVEYARPYLDLHIKDRKNLRRLKLTHKDYKDILLQSNIDIHNTNNFLLELGQIIPTNI